MSKYLVQTIVTCYFTLEVEANNLDEAENRAVNDADQMMGESRLPMDEFTIEITGTTGLVVQEDGHGQ